MADLERTWKVGELARDTGLTIRALHPHATVAVQRARATARRSGTDADDPLQLLLALIDNSGTATLLDDGAVDLVALRGELTAALEP